MASTEATLVHRALRADRSIDTGAQGRPRLTVAHISLALLFASALTACSREVVVVRIFPDRYEIGPVSSRLATPAVDEAVRLKPGAVHMYVCRSTAPQKIIQFQSELDARYKGEVKLGFMDKDQCPA